MNDSTRYMSAADVKSFFGGISSMTIWRWSNDPEMGFPRPLMLNKRRYFDRAEIEAWAQGKRAQAEASADAA